MFYIVQIISNKINSIKRNNRNKPDKIIYILIWLSLIIILTLIFHRLGTFNLKYIDNIKKGLGYNNLIKKSNILNLNKIINNYTNRPKPLINLINQYTFD